MFGKETLCKAPQVLEWNLAMGERYATTTIWIPYTLCAWVKAY